MDKSKQLGEDKILKLIIRFSIPAIIGMLVNAIYNIVDRIFIGNGVSTAALAGVAIGFPIMLVLMAFAMLIGIGANSLVAIRLGEQKKDEAELIMGNALVLLVSITAFIAFFGLIFLDPLLSIFGASAAVLPYAKEYLRIILWGAVFQSIGMGMNNFIRSEGNPKIAMYTMLIGAVLNTLLDPLFIFVFKMGIAGAAYATILSQAISAGWVLYHFMYGKSVLKLHISNFKLKLKIVGKIVSLGTPPFLIQFAASILNAIMNRSLAIYGGDVAVSAMSAVMSITMLFLMPIFGISQGVQPIIGYNYGAQKYDRVKEALKLGIIAATIVVSFGFIVTRLFSVQLISIFNAKDAELIAFGSHTLKVFLIFMPIIGFQILASNYFLAVGKPAQAGLLSLSRQVLILIPAMLILPKFFGVEGVLYAGPLSDLLSSVITGLFLYLELKHLDQKHESMQLKEA
ncbi:MAG: MATE family efflux transporter [Clostridiales bacterium GWB2_37_7]|nr:MAG: MATE family efflux transporter [Clostridiales bacterium GWB2_37_7]